MTFRLGVTPLLAVQRAGRGGEGRMARHGDLARRGVAWRGSTLLHLLLQQCRAAGGGGAWRAVRPCGVLLPASLPVGV